MYIKAYYVSPGGYHRVRRFDTHDQLDAWLQEMTNPDYDPDAPSSEPASHYWKTAEQGGEIRYLDEVYTIREPADLVGHGVTFFPGPRPEKPLGRFIITAATYCKEFSQRPQDDLVYELHGRPEGTPADNEPTRIAWMTLANMKRLLSNSFYTVGIHDYYERCLAVPCTDLLDSAGKPLNIRTDHQMNNYAARRRREQQQDAIRQVIRTLTANYRLSYETDAQGNTAYILRFDYDQTAQPLSVIALSPDRFEEDLRRLQATVHERILKQNN